MRRALLAFASLLIIWPMASAVAGINPGAPVAALSDEAKPEELRFTFEGTRLAPNLYWRIDINGKGEVSAPASVGYEPLPRLIADPVFQIAPGVHSFDIGPEGYREVRAFLSRITDGKHDPATMRESGVKCAVEGPYDAGSLQIAWSDKGGGVFRLTNTCLAGWGQYFKSHMLQSWHVLARHMHAKGHAAVTVKQQPAVTPPRKLSLIETAIWTQNTIRWEINADNRGWFELLQDGNSLSTDPLDPVYMRAGRYEFQLDPPFQQAVLRELKPYLDGSAPPGSCENEVGMSDQPIVKISWVDETGASKSFNSDLGCPSFAARMLPIKLLFAELLHKSRVGDAVLVK